MHPKFKAMLEVQMIGVLSFVGKFNKKRETGNPLYTITSCNYVI